MQELAREIETVAEHGHEFTLRKAASKWAAHCIEELDGTLLSKGLAVSAALAEFMNEFERCDPDHDEQ